MEFALHPGPLTDVKIIPVTANPHPILSNSSPFRKHQNPFAAMMSGFDVWVRQTFHASQLIRFVRVKDHPANGDSTAVFPAVSCMRVLASGCRDGRHGDSRAPEL